MQYTTIGADTDRPLKVSRICLGTMTWGEQNTEQEAFAQMDYALDHQVNFFDAAEMYPVPMRRETSGLTEQYIGNWFAKTGKRNQVVLASKVSGPGMLDYLRPPPVDLDPKGIRHALEHSLKRLQTDRIDLYQLHWPSRTTNYFGKLNYTEASLDGVPLEESLGAMEQLVKEGKVLQVGVSNETAWGVMHAKRIAERNGWQPLVTIQNPYNLLNRAFEVGLAEVAVREHVPLLAYSPMAFGALSGKYLLGTDTPSDRLNQFSHFPRYSTKKGVAATRDHIALAGQMGLTPATLSLAFVNHQSFVASNIIGATSLTQLAENIASIQVQLTADQLEAIETFSQTHSNPCP